MNISNLFSIKGKTAIVTGGTGVLGGAMALGLAAAGVNTVVLGRKQSNGERLVEDIRKAGGEGLFVQADVLSAEDLHRVSDTVVSRYGAIDILVNAAGGNLSGAVIMPQQNFFDLKMEEFEKTRATLTTINNAVQKDVGPALAAKARAENDLIAVLNIGRANSEEILRSANALRAVL